MTERNNYLNHIRRLQLENKVDKRTDKQELNLAARKAEVETHENGIALIAKERQRQISVEGWTPEHDASHRFGQMSVAAACYAVEGTDASVSYPNDDPEGSGWPWDRDWWKPKDRVRNLVRAGALIAAEIDRELSDQPAAAPVHKVESGPLEDHLYPHQRCNGCGEEFETTNQRLTHYCKGSSLRRDSASEPPAISELGEFWLHWFHCVGEHAIIEVVHATTDLVLAEREIAVRDHLELIRKAAEKCKTVNEYAIYIVHRKSDWDALVKSVKGEK